MEREVSMEREETDATDILTSDDLTSPLRLEAKSPSGRRAVTTVVRTRRCATHPTRSAHEIVALVDALSKSGTMKMALARHHVTWPSVRHLFEALSPYALRRLLGEWPGFVDVIVSEHAHRNSPQPCRLSVCKCEFDTYSGCKRRRAGDECGTTEG